MKVKINVSAGEQTLERTTTVDTDRELPGAIAVALEAFRCEHPDIAMLESGSVEFGRAD